MSRILQMKEVSKQLIHLAKGGGGGGGDHKSSENIQV